MEIVVDDKDWMKPGLPVSTRATGCPAGSASPTYSRQRLLKNSWCCSGIYGLMYCPANDADFVRTLERKELVEPLPGKQAQTGKSLLGCTTESAYLRVYVRTRLRVRSAWQTPRCLVAGPTGHTAECLWFETTGTQSVVTTGSCRTLPDFCANASRWVDPRI